MRKVFCDACGNEVKDNIKQFETLVHIADGLDNLSRAYRIIEIGDKGVVNSIPTSGRPVIYDVCSKCYNEIYGAAFEKFAQIRKENNNE